jgi:hypothetical protein
MIKPPDNDRPMLETFPWSHVGVAGLAWSVVWFLVWSIAEGIPASIIVAVVPDDSYRFLPHALVGVFSAWLMAIVQTQYRLRKDRVPNPVAFAFVVLLLLLWPPACYWARAILKEIPAFEIDKSSIASGVLAVIQGGVPWTAGVIVTLAIGIPANVEIAHTVYNRTEESRLCRGTYALVLAVVPAVLCATNGGTYIGFLAYGAASNALMLIWYRRRVKEELANIAMQRIADPRHASCGAGAAPESAIR